MAQSTIDTHREGAEIYTGDAVCRQKCIELLQAFNLPGGLLPLEDVEEVGFQPASGFVWLRQRKSRNHTFRKISRLVSYAAEVTAFVEDRRMRRLTGVKSKELLIWITLSEFYVDPKDPSRITFKTPAGLYRSFPASAFELEGEDKKKKEAAAGSAAGAAPEAPAAAADAM